jgi:uncharacterized repeat protein (TIGR01451 family)
MNLRRTAALVAALAGVLAGPAYALPPSADLAVELADDADPVAAGRNITYTVTIVNNGPDRATGVSLTDTVPAGLAFVSADASPGNCSGTTTITCNLGVFDHNETVTVALVFKTSTTGTVTNTVQVAASQDDPNMANNAAAATTGVVAGQRPCTISGAVGPDVLRGTPASDVICGLGGDDVVYAGGGMDIVRAGPGADVIYAGDGGDRVFGGDGADVAYGQLGNDRIVGGRNADVLYGGGGSDALFGSLGFDVLFGGPGNDFCRRGLGGGVHLGC